MEGEGIDLRDLDERFKGVAAADKNAPAPDGTYQAALEIFRVERAKDEEGNRTGAPVLVWGFRIVGPKCAGRMTWHRNQMATDINISWLKADLETAGLVLEKLSDLPDHLEELIGAVFEITVRSKAQYTNVYINSRVDPGSVLVEDEGNVPF
jgi:hypothetical protein